MRFSTLLSATVFFELSIAGYVLQDDYMTDFYGNFDFFTEADPTDGFVKFVDEATARQTNLINASSTTVAQWGVDAQNNTPEGRPSMRLQSKKVYDSGLIVLDVAHMPFGCGTWPAFWTTGPNWPMNGEIDIIEGVNEVMNNSVTLHTGPGCTIGQDTAQFSGEVSTENCYIDATGQSKNAGCSIRQTTPQSYGTGLNENGGGVYATQWTSDGITVYFFPRGSEPTDVLGDQPDPTGWGKPVAKFSGGCNIADTFKAQTIVFDTTFCGQWAGATDVWGAGTCAQKASTCNEYVQNNPEAFAEAYWTINALKVYQDNGTASAPSASASPSHSTAPLSTSAPVALPSTSKIVAPVPTTSVVSNVPSGSTAVPAAPVPTSAKPSFGVPFGYPSATMTQRPKRPTQSPMAAPTGANGMPGFHFPPGRAGQTATVPAAAGQSAAPAAKKARVARHAREHRRKLMRHHVHV